MWIVEKLYWPEVQNYLEKVIPNQEIAKTEISQKIQFLYDHIQQIENDPVNLALFITENKQKILSKGFKEEWKFKNISLLLAEMNNLFAKAYKDRKQLEFDVAIEAINIKNPKKWYQAILYVKEFYR